MAFTNYKQGQQLAPIIFLRDQFLKRVQINSLK